MTCAFKCLLFVYFHFRVNFRQAILYSLQVLENKIIQGNPYMMLHYSYCMNDTNNINMTDFVHPYTDMITWNLTFLTQVINKEYRVGHLET